MPVASDVVPPGVVPRREISPVPGIHTNARRSTLGLADVPLQPTTRSLLSSAQAKLWVSAPIDPSRIGSAAGSDQYAASLTPDCGLMVPVMAPVRFTSRGTPPVRARKPSPGLQVQPEPPITMPDPVASPPMAVAKNRPPVGVGGRVCIV